ncbi:aminoglycoside N(3)-acetyltransferase [Cohnella thailandensis]|uniref:Aminoglycoside N(3)-acetyltransferase n=1 Tax=Cohnella thailandensis TaxID=557557 RepID=A0A841SX16_9BACL|nr:AAC(3) family N-acetyltransferase [Cohnella thailandensis]MBB6636793.1 AAC(3) family N-acetyltransferase [Cohnella thailandensis]MBP1973330.1 aminoglycoside 3-N-acetyltransferase [Cohnella thailandensis]
MFEQQAILRSPKLMTRDSLGNDLRQLGIKEGQTLIVHSSLSRIGWVCGGPVAVVQALMDVLTAEGTLVMPAHSGDYSEPSKWQLPPVPESWWEEIRGTMPVFDPQVTPTRGMGAIPECFRTWQGTLRSNHPALSFAAWGKNAERITREHSLEYALGERSPLARLYELGAQVLLLGVGYDSNTSFHLAENRIPNPPETLEGAPVLENGKRVWKAYREIAFDTDRFEEIGAEFEKARPVTKGSIGVAESRLFDLREGVDFATEWLKERTGGVHTE